MNTKILQKCVDALKEPAPDLSYVRGMIETLIETNAPQITHTPINHQTYVPVAGQVKDKDAESEALAKYLGGATRTVTT